MRLSPRDANAIVGLANRMGVDPGSLAGLMHMESGINPNIWGGSGGNYRGLIQFGPGARKEVGLPDDPMTIEAQVPYVEEYFKQRGFKPGMSAEQMYRTVLVGNPHQSGTDSFGTNSDKAGARMKPGGDLYDSGMAALKNATAKADYLGMQSSSTRSGGSPSAGLDPNGIGIEEDSSPSLPISNQIALAGLAAHEQKAGGLDHGAIFNRATASPVERMAGRPDVLKLLNLR